MRQLWDWKASADVDTMGPELLKVYGQICGWTLARGHARSGDRVAIASLPRSSSHRSTAAIARFAVCLRRAERPRPRGADPGHRRRHHLRSARRLTPHTTLSLAP